MTCLWFDDNAEDAVKYYLSVFKKSKRGKTAYYGKGGPGREGSVLTIQFYLEGQEFLALNGGPAFKFSEAVSLIVNCKTQKEVDYYWEKLSRGGTKMQCGWVKDKFDFSWQIVPEMMGDMLTDKNSDRSSRVMDAMMKMNKLDIKKLKAAFD